MIASTDIMQITCCEKMKENSGSFDTFRGGFNGAYIQLFDKYDEPYTLDGIDYCPFCGKKLKEA